MIPPKFTLALFPSVSTIRLTNLPKFSSPLTANGVLSKLRGNTTHGEVQTTTTSTMAEDALKRFLKDGLRSPCGEYIYHDRVWFALPSVLTKLSSLDLEAVPELSSQSLNTDPVRMNGRHPHHPARQEQPKSSEKIETSNSSETGMGDVTNQTPEKSPSKVFNELPLISTRRNRPMPPPKPSRLKDIVSPLSTQAVCAVQPERGRLRTRSPDLNLDYDTFSLPRRYLNMPTFDPQRFHVTSYSPEREHELVHESKQRAHSDCKAKILVRSYGQRRVRMQPSRSPSAATTSASSLSSANNDGLTRSSPNTSFPLSDPTSQADVVPTLKKIMEEEVREASDPSKPRAFAAWSAKQRKRMRTVEWEKADQSTVNYPDKSSGTLSKLSNWLVVAEVRERGRTGIGKQGMLDCFNVYGPENSCTKDPESKGTRWDVGLGRINGWEGEISDSKDARLRREVVEEGREIVPTRGKA